MASQLTQIEQSFSESYPIAPYLAPTDDASPSITARTLELTARLQTTIEISELMEIFVDHIGRYIDIDGTRYHNPDHGLEILSGTQPPNTCCYLLTIQKENLGEIRFFRRRKFTAEEIRAIEDLLCALPYPLRNALKYRRAVQSAFLDPLTGIKNRAAMDMALKREIDLSHRQGTALSVILLDIDYFKRVNDSHGHTVGDQCLRAIAQCAERSIRSSDFLFRCGGEEFLVLLSYTDNPGALQLAERIRHNIEKLVPPDRVQRPLTVSLGVSTLRPDDRCLSLYRRADEALYAAKRAGRNQVACEVDP